MQFTRSVVSHAEIALALIRDVSVTAYEIDEENRIAVAQIHALLAVAEALGGPGATSMAPRLPR